MNFSGILFRTSDLIGVVAFALSGAMTALKYKQDLFGVVVLGVTTALGGGMIRDLLIGRIPPMMFRDYRYALIAVSTSALIFLLARFCRNLYHKHETHIESLANVFDAIGLGAFTVVGMQAGIDAGYSDNGFLLVFLSLLTGIGGGILRDLFVQRMPGVLHKHVYAVAVLAGALLYLILLRLQVSDLIATPVTILLVFTIRMLATKFRWNLPHAE